MTDAMPLKAERVVVAMSGGVDSSVAAALLVERGCDVVGISMRLAPESARGKSSGCCSIEDFRDAGRVAERLGIPHYTLDMRERFDRAVVRPFVDEYLAGRTPSPCILCNREIKFSLLRRKAAELGARWVATGHYARRAHRDGAWRLLRAGDDAKDQSYFLFELGQDELARTLFPVGDLPKHAVRAEAARLGLDVASKPDSQEICFVPDGRYADFVERVGRDRVRGGRIVDESGRDLGGHGGVHRYTVGQRRGLGVSSPEPLYVKRIDAAAATVVVAPRAAIGARGLVASAPHWVSGRPEPDGTAVRVRVRHKHSPAPARVFAHAHGAKLRVEFDEPIEGVSPGQAAVLYRDDEVLGGAWIERALSEGDVRGEREGACA